MLHTDSGIEQMIIFSLKERKGKKEKPTERFPSQKMFSEKNRTTLQEKIQVPGKYELLL